MDDEPRMRVRDRAGHQQKQPQPGTQRQLPPPDVFIDGTSCDVLDCEKGLAAARDAGEIDTLLGRHPPGER